jgi:hypothetical protein
MERFAGEEMHLQTNASLSPVTSLCVVSIVVCQFMTPSELFA